MDKLKVGWYSEISDLLPGRSFSMEVEQILHKEKTPFQEILIVKTKSHGIALILDGILQCTEFDEFSYQEMIAFLPLFSHPEPRRVLIVGGGDGGVAREVAKHPLVKTIDIVEIDQRVVELSKIYLPFMSKGFLDLRVNLHITDGFKFMEERLNTYDIIITDSSNPIGPAVSLFSKRYFELMTQLIRPGGIMCSQAGTFWGNLKTAMCIYDHCKKVYVKAAFATCYVPSYPGGQTGFVLGSMNKNTDFSNPFQKLSKELLKDMRLRYYTTEMHRAAFVLPAFVGDAFKEVEYD